MTRLIIIIISFIFLISCGSRQSWSCVGDCENGEGTRLWKDGGMEKGTWANGKLNGQGFQLFGTTSEFSGDTYDGEFEDGIYSGHGTYYDKSEDSKYVGQWKNGRPNGKGKGTWGENSKFPNTTYEGELKDGLMHGFGTKVWGQAEEEKYAASKYTGEWKYDKMDGNGIYEWSDGSYYEGYWKNGVQHGEGTYVFAGGEIFKGTWINGYCEELAKKLGLE